MNILIAGDFFISDIFKNQPLIDKPVRELFASADYRIVNLESPITADDPKNKILKTGPHLRSSEDIVIPYLKQLHIDMVTLANNHILDYGEQGLIDTFHALKKNNIDRVGAGNNLIEASQPFTIEKEGLKIAILNFCEHEWSIAEKNKGGANPLDIIDNVKQIQAAKANHDKVICIIHGGHEYYNLPSPRMQKQYRFYADNGADAIVGHHTHCIGGYENYKSVPVYYSLGNFLFTMNAGNPDWYIGLILEIEWKDDQLKTTLHPVCQEKETFKLYLPKEKEKEEILNRVQSYAKIIQDETLLEQSWEQYISLKSKEYLNYWSPTSFIRNRYVRSALNKSGINFKNEKVLRLFFNLIRCEAHSDLSKEVIREYLKKQ